VSRNRLLLLATLMAAGIPSCQRPGPKPDTAADKQKVSQVGEREIRALSAGNVDSNLAVLTADVVMMPPNQEVLTGSDAVRSWLREGHGQFTFDFRYTDSQVDIAGDWAIERYRGTGTITPKKGGRPIKERVKGIHIYRRQPDGSWLIALVVWNSDLAASGNP
jgi:ketosteroid isomerase-like protein